MTEDTIFFDARDRVDPAQRAAFLDEACAGDPVLRARIEALLLSQEAAGDFPDRSAVERPTDAQQALPASIDRAEAPPEPRRPLPGEPAERDPNAGGRIGPYKLLQQIGEGGMGVVWMAEQQEPVRRRVALKVIKPGMDSARVLARFEAERQALALMDHPNIAKVFDAGTTAGGRPYFVMELVRGIPITRYCDDNRLTPAERLALLVPVCQAVQHAHQKGIIHRDLKPANVLVASYDGRPVPKVIDFGIAKAMGQELTERTLFTDFGAIVGTLEYMSPEQANVNAMDVDTRSDVYALGVLLYVLLTGSTPLPRRRLKAAGIVEAMRVIREEETPRPSTRLSEAKEELASLSAQRRTEPAQLTRLVRGELDWIVMKALDKDRARRYETANSLARDLERYLADEPVEACPPSAGYRLRKFASKNRRLLTTGAAFATLLVVGVVAATWQALRATQAERDATAAEWVATEQRDEARNTSARLERTQEELQTTLYAARANLIQSAWEADNAPRAVELLELQRPAPGSKDLRGFEWWYWHRLCHSDLRTVDLRYFTQPVLSSDGRYVAGPAAGSSSEKTGQLDVLMWELTSGKVWRSWKASDLGADEVAVCMVAISPDSTRLAAAVSITKEGSARSLIKVWNAVTGNELRTIPLTIRSVSGLAFSPDATRLAIAGTTNPDPKVLGGEIQIWNVATGDNLLTLRGGRYQSGISFSPDGARVAAADAEAFRLKVWDAGTGKELLALKTKGTVAGRGPTFSPDGKRLAAVSAFGWSADNPAPLQIWNAVTGEEILTVARWSTQRRPGMRDDNFSDPVAFSPDGARVACVGPDRIVQVWGTSAGEIQVQFTLPRHRNAVTALAFSPDGTRLYSADRTMVTIWDASAVGRLAHHHYELRDAIATFSPDCARLAIHESVGEKLLVSDLSGEKRVWLEGLGERTNQLTWSPDGGRIAGVANSSKEPGAIKVRVWDAATGMAIQKRAIRRGTNLNRSHAVVRFDADGNCLAAAVFFHHANHPEVEKRENPSQFVLQNVANGKDLITVTGRPEEFTMLAFSSGGRWVATFGKPGPGATSDKVRLWDAVSAAEIPGISCPFKLAGLAFNPDGRLLAGLSPDEAGYRFVIWDTATGAVVSILKSHFRAVTSHAFTPDSRRIALAGRTQTGAHELRLWDTATGHELITIKTERFKMRRLAFSPDGHRLLAAGNPTEEQESTQGLTFTAKGALQTATASFALNVGQVHVWYATPRQEGRPP